ncbi:MAG: PilW family protein [Gammaproteobacteria bacterium]|nr:PilW family protein [Gammaproteobacteria bacterium]
MKSESLVRRRAAQGGLTVVEIMVAVTISLILLAGVLQIFISSRGAYRLQQGLSRLQENGRFAMNFLVKDIRMAGYMGCVKSDPNSITSTLFNPNAFQNNFSVSLQGYEFNGTGPGANYTLPAADPAPDPSTGDWTPALDASLQGKVIPGTDVIVIRRMSNQSTELVPPYTNAAQLFASYSPTGTCPGGGASYDGMCNGDVVMVSDCAKSRVFQITNLTPTGGNTAVNVVHAGNGSQGNSTTSWGGASDQAGAFGQGAQLAKAETIVYYVGQAGFDRSGNTCPAATDCPPALYSMVNGGTPQELVDGVENMQILYGVDTDADGVANQYVTADVVNNNNAWANVVTVRVSLLLRTPANVTNAPDTNTYLLTGNTAGGATKITPYASSASDRDLRMRHVFTTTIKIRNRGS